MVTAATKAPGKPGAVGQIDLDDPAEGFVPNCEVPEA